MLYVRLSMSNFRGAGHPPYVVPTLDALRSTKSEMSQYTLVFHTERVHTL